MKELFVLIVLIAVAYFFRNYQTFGEQNLRPLAVQWNYDREANPQVLCDLLAPTATVEINDVFPRFDVQMDSYKEQACQYFKDAAQHFRPVPVEKNGYIWDHLQNFEITDVDYLRGTAKLSYSWSSKQGSFGLKMRKNDVSYVGDTHTTMLLRLRPFKDMDVTHYVFKRKFEAVSND